MSKVVRYEAGAASALGILPLLPSRSLYHQRGILQDPDYSDEACNHATTPDLLTAW
jgi:hypothetical protein